MKLSDALSIAQDLTAYLSPSCMRIAVAGSIRRQKPEVKDIEIVAIPKPSQFRDMFGRPIPHTSTPLDIALHDLTNINVPKGDIHLQRVRGGQRYRQYHLPQHHINLDLFIVIPPAQWGYILALRTGPRKFSRWLVTPRSKNGALPSHLTARDGGIYFGNQLQPTPDESDLFRLFGLPDIEPAERDRPSREWPIPDTQTPILDSAYL